MWKFSRLASLMVLLLCSLAVGGETANVIVNSDFSRGFKGWGVTMPKVYRAAGSYMKIVNGGVDLFVPPNIPKGSAPMLLINTCRLTNDTLYLLSYDLEVEQEGVMRHLYQLSVPPFSSLGCERNTPVKPGKVHITDAFTTVIRPTDTRHHLTFNVSRLRGKARLSNIRLTRQALLAPELVLSQPWRVFTDVQAPSSFAEIPASLPSVRGGQVQGKVCRPDSRGTIRLDAVSGDRRCEDHRVAVLYLEFVSPREGVVTVGMSADWWMEVYLNGERMYDTLEMGNGSQMYTPDDHEVQLFAKAGRNVLAVKVDSGSAGWRYVIGKMHPKNMITQGPDWLPVDIAKTQIEGGTALDMSGLVEAPAGKFGRVAINERGELVYAQRPNVPIRLQGFNGFSQIRIGDDELFRRAVREFAQTARRQGYSLLRVNGLLDSSLMDGSTEDMSINPKMMDRWDYAVSELKKQGIYIHLVVLSYGLYDTREHSNVNFRLRNSHRLLLYLGGEWERAHFKYGAETVLNHVNPYTGLAWKDDPAIAFVEFYNEQGSGFANPVGHAKAIPGGYELLLKRWRDWLAVRYKDGVPEELKKALGGKALSEAPIPNFWGDKASPLSNAFGMFRAQMVVDGARWCEDVVRKTGYKGLTTNYNAMKRFADVYGRWQCIQVVDLHSYFRHPAGGWGAPGCRVGQDSSLDMHNANGWWRGINASRLLGRPTIVSEYNHAYWNPYQHEGGLSFSAYSAFQGYGSIQIHAGINYDNLSHRPVINSFSVANSPVVRANEFLSNCLYARGDVTPAKHLVDYVVPRERLERDGMSNMYMGREQSLISLLTGFGVTFPWAPTPAGIGRTPRADLQILPDGTSDVHDADWYFNVIESASGAFDLDAFVKTLKQKGILKGDNATDVKNGVFESDTGEITLRAKEQLLKVVTARSEGVTLKAQAAERLGRLTVDSSSVHGTVALCAVDGKTVAESDRLVLIYSTRCMNDRTVFSHDGGKKIAEGRFPILLKRGELKARFKPQAKAEAFKLYSLNFDGTRKERVPITVKEGQVVIDLDTGKLKKGPTTFFELVREN